MQASVFVVGRSGWLWLLSREEKNWISAGRDHGKHLAFFRKRTNLGMKWISCARCGWGWKDKRGLHKIRRYRSFLFFCFYMMLSLEWCYSWIRLRQNSERYFIYQKFGTYIIERNRKKNDEEIFFVRFRGDVTMRIFVPINNKHSGSRFYLPNNRWQAKNPFGQKSH